jgi:hypothetical protein
MPSPPRTSTRAAPSRSQGLGPTSTALRPPRPCHGAVVALRGLGDRLVRGTPGPALAAWASWRRPRARRRWLVQGRITSERPESGQVTAGWRATPRGLAGAVARVSHTAAMPPWKPAEEAGEQAPRTVRRRPGAPAKGLIPVGGTIQGNSDGEGPRACGTRQRATHRDDAPRMRLPLGRVARGGPDSSAMAPRAKHLWLRAFGDRLIPRQKYRPRRAASVQQAGSQCTGEHPGRPAALRPPRRRRRVAWRWVPRSAPHVGDGPAPRGQEGAEQEPEASGGSGRGTCGLTDGT